MEAEDRRDDQFQLCIVLLGAQWVEGSVSSASWGSQNKLPRRKQRGILA